MQTQDKRQERISLSGLIATIIISNVAVLAYLAPYA
jgi:hypothetical protein